MKALSIKQPWAWAILNGKDVENRTWKTNFRGQFLIHASRSFDVGGYRWLKNRSSLFNVKIPEIYEYQRGGFIGCSNIIDCVRESENPFFSGPFGFILSETKPILFIKYKGQLGFFNVNIGEIKL